VTSPALLETNFRYSSYHINILDRAFVYVLFNMLIVPGLAIPTGFSFFSLVSAELSKTRFLLSNFYNLTKGDFFVILVLHQIGFGMLFGFVPLGQLWNSYLSPTIFRARARLNQTTHAAWKLRGCGFEFGYNYVLSATVLSIVFVFGWVEKKRVANSLGPGSGIFPGQTARGHLPAHHNLWGRNR